MTDTQLTWDDFAVAPFRPYLELRADGEVIATLFHHDKPEVAYALVPVEREDGTIEMGPGALAGLDEDEVGWCLQWTDEGLSVRVISSLGADYADAVKEIAEAWARERLERTGVRQPAEAWRLWGEERLAMTNQSIALASAGARVAIERGLTEMANREASARLAAALEDVEDFNSFGWHDHAGDAGLLC